MSRQLTALEIADRTFPAADPGDAVMIEHRHTIGGQPDVALEPGRPEAQRELERLDRVLRCMGTRAPMGESDRWIET